MGRIGRGMAGLVLGGAALLGLALQAAPVLAQAAPGQAYGDPPALVGRIARMTGTVSQHGAGADRWEPALANFPLSAGSALWTEPGAGAEVEVGPDRWALDGGTQLQFDRLDDEGVTATLSRGELYVRLREQPGDGARVTVRTPRGVVELRQAGRYGVAAGDAEHPTQVAVVEGAARIEAPDNVDQAVAAGQAALIIGNAGAAQTATLVPLQPDPFLTAQLARERQPARAAQAPAPPAPVRRMTGAAALDESGRWEPSPEYGTVWYPDVTPDWLPYRAGRWAWITPWGWTWVDDQPWGFATSHYGRWVHAADRWGWAPVLPGTAIEAPPVFAPALVAFTALAGGALRSRPVGWVPLGWREPYLPPYRASPAYVQRINVHNVTNVNALPGLDPRAAYGRFLANRAAATFVPAQVLASSQPVARAVQPVPPTLRLRPVFGGVPVMPGPATAGVTPTVARQMRLPPPAFPPAPGPAFATSRGNNGIQVAPGFGASPQRNSRPDLLGAGTGFGRGAAPSGYPPPVASPPVASPPVYSPGGPPQHAMPRRPNLLMDAPQPLPATLPNRQGAGHPYPAPYGGQPPGFPGDGGGPHGHFQGHLPGRFPHPSEGALPSPPMARWQPPPQVQHPAAPPPIAFATPPQRPAASPPPRVVAPSAPQRPPPNQPPPGQPPRHHGQHPP